MFSTTPLPIKSNTPKLIPTFKVNVTKKILSGKLGSISTTLSCLVCVPPQEELRESGAGSFPEQRLVIGPSGKPSRKVLDS